MTYCANMIDSLPYLLMKCLNFMKSFFLSLVFLSLIFLVFPMFPFFNFPFVVLDFMQSTTCSNNLHNTPILCSFLVMTNIQVLAELLYLQLIYCHFRLYCVNQTHRRTDFPIAGLEILPLLGVAFS